MPDAFDNSLNNISHPTSGFRIAGLRRPAKTKEANMQDANRLPLEVAIERADNRGLTGFERDFYIRSMTGESEPSAGNEMFRELFQQVTDQDDHPIAVALRNYTPSAFDR